MHENNPDTALAKIIQEKLNANRAEFELPKDRVPLASPTFGLEEILETIDCLTSSRVTMGKRVQDFEIQFAEYVGVKHAVMVNSGSSANLLAVSALMSHQFSRRLIPGDEVIVPAVTWPTTVYPLAQLGLTPVVVDAQLDTFNISPDSIERAIGPKTKAVCIVPILGNPCNIKEIKAICQKHHLLLIEDTCESLGSSVGGRLCGSEGDVGTFSFFFSHHMTTMEGGMVVTSNDELADILRCQRAHGWTRNVSKKKIFEGQNPEIDPRFLFIDVGYNLRPMEIQAAFGKWQLKKLPEMNRARRELAQLLKDGLSAHSKYLQLPQEQANGVHTWFGFPFLVKKGTGVDRRELMNHLEAKGIETRPITGGNLTRQPSYAHFKWRQGDELVNADLIHEQGIYFGTHPGMNFSHGQYIIGTFASFFNEFEKAKR